MVTFSIFRKVEDKIHPVPLKERIEHASFRLQLQLDKLEHMYSRLKQRDIELFQRCVGAQVSKDFGHSRIYANECAEIRKIAQVVLASELALERVILRLKTVEEFGTLVTQLAPVMGIVKETKSKIAGVVPQVAMELDEINGLLGDLTNETGEVTGTNSSIEATDPEAKKILEETGLIAEEKLRDHFPELPTIQTQTPQKIEAIPELTTNLPNMEADIEDQVYDYAKKHNGEMSVQSCAQQLGASPNEVKEAIQRLQTRGKLVVG